MDKVLVFAQTEKDLVNNKDLDDGPLGGQRLQMKLMQFRCNAERDPVKRPALSWGPDQPCWDNYIQHPASVINNATENEAHRVKLTIRRPQTAARIHGEGIQGHRRVWTRYCSERLVLDKIHGGHQELRGCQERAKQSDCWPLFHRTLNSVCGRAHTAVGQGQRRWSLENYPAAHRRKQW